MKTKNLIRVKLRNVLRQRLIIAGLIVLIAFVSLVFILFFGTSNKINAAVNGDIRSIASGNWNNLAIWQKYNGTAWVAATVIPSSADKQITIQSTHTVVITAALTVDEVVVESGAMLALNSGITLTLKKVAIPDLKVYGIFRNAGIISIAGGTSITYYDSGIYQHNYTTTAGTIPVGIWNPGSICEIMGYTTNNAMPAGLNQTFSDVKWNCTSQSTDINFSGGLTTFTGNLNIVSTGTNQLLFANSNFTFNVTGNLTISGGILNMISVANKSVTLNLTGDLIVTGGTTYFTSGNMCTGIVNLTGNYTQSGGTFNFSQGNSATTTLNISGNYIHIGGAMTTTGIGALGQVVFNNAGPQNFSSSGNIVTGNVDYTVNSGSTLNMGTSSMIGRNFTLAAGGELGIGSYDGITSSGSAGNIGVSGTRTFNAGGYYLYNGVANQNTGNGLPATVSKLSVSNGNYLTLSNTVAVSGTLNFISGKILTGNNELQVINTSATAIAGNSSSCFVVGNLRRTVTGTGTFAFPVGSFTMYELMNVTLTGATGFTSLLGTFQYAVTNDTLYPLNVNVSGIDMTEMLDYGYWTLVPNSPLTGGKYSLELNEAGFSNMLSNGTFYSLLVRNNPTSLWQATGTQIDNTQIASGGVVTAVRSDLTSFYQYGIALGDYPTFSSPSLISGTAGQAGAVYLFQDVLRGIDAQISIVNLYNGATLSDVDNGGTGYNESFQPFVNFPANKDSYIEWLVNFKVANTNNDTVLSKVTATGVDVDGASDIREYIVATMPTSYSLDPSTQLTMSNDSGRYKAMGPTFSIANIDTSHHEIMYQLNYNNVSKLTYRTGALNIAATLQTRQTSLFFKSFLTGSPKIALPIKLVEFKATLQKTKVLLEWITASEVNNDYFTIERSADGRVFYPILTKKGAGNSSTNLYYSQIDEHALEGKSYYRLKQTDFDGKFTYSDINVIDNSKFLYNGEIEIQNLSPNPFSSDIKIDFIIKSKGKVDFSLLNSIGEVVENKTIIANEGTNTVIFETGPKLSTGVYFLVAGFKNDRLTKKIIKN